MYSREAVRMLLPLGGFFVEPPPVDVEVVGSLVEVVVSGA
jgi:hypothetical protein